MPNLGGIRPMSKPGTKPLDLAYSRAVHRAPEPFQGQQHHRLGDQAPDGVE